MLSEFLGPVNDSEKDAKRKYLLRHRRPRDVVEEAKEEDEDSKQDALSSEHEYVLTPLGSRPPGLQSIEASS